MTDEELKQLVASLAISQKQTDKEIKELVASQKNTDAKMAEMSAEITRVEKKLAESRARTEAGFERLQKEHEKTEAGFRKLQKQINQVSKQLGDLGHTQGDVAEDLFRRNVEYLLNARGIAIDYVETNIMTDHAEYDIVAINGDVVVIVEVKNKLKSDHIQHFLNVQLPKVKQELPDFANHKIYGGVGALVIPKQLEQQAIKAGLFVFTQNQDGGAALINPEDFTAKAF